MSRSPKKHLLPQGLRTWAGNPSGKLGKPAPSSRKQAKPAGISPANPSYGILHGGQSSLDKLARKADRIFRTGSRQTPNGQGRLKSKAKRQVQ